MSKHGVCSELGKLGRPQADGKNAFRAERMGKNSSTRIGGRHSRHPISIDIAEALACADTLWSLKGSDQDAIRAEKVRDGRSLCKELWVGEDIKAAVGLRVGLEDSAHRLSSAAWHCRFLDYNFVRGGNSGNTAGSKFDVARENASGNVL